MKAVTFPEQNVMLAEDQPEYETLPVFCEFKVIPASISTSGESKAVPWSMTACFELSDEEIEEIVKTKKIWHKQMLFGGNFQPILLTTESPFDK